MERHMAVENLIMAQYSKYQPLVFIKNSSISQETGPTTRAQIPMRDLLKHEMDIFTG